MNGSPDAFPVVVPPSGMPVLLPVTLTPPCRLVTFPRQPGVEEQAGALDTPWRGGDECRAVFPFEQAPKMTNIGLSARGRQLLSLLRVGQPAEALERQGVDPAALAALRAAGLVQDQDATVPPADYQDIFAGWKSQKGMLIDDGRTLGFEAAIRAAVRPGDRVVDVGTGSGILAMFAARAGAGQVHALEITRMADWAERLAAANGLTNMTVVRGDAAVFDAGGPVDVVTGEFAGMWLLEEWRHYAAFVQVRDRWLKPGGRVVPRASGLYLSQWTAANCTMNGAGGSLTRRSMGSTFRRC